MKKIPLPPLDRGWYWFVFTYRTTEGRPFEVNFAAQSMEDAETRVRMMRETAQFDGQVIAEYDATDADVAHGRMLQRRGTVPGTSMVSACCGCRWKKHADGTLQLYDADQKPCPRCDNAPNPPLRNEEPEDAAEREAEKNATPFVVDRERVACAIAATTFSDLKPFSKSEWDKMESGYRLYRVEEADAAIAEYERQRAEWEAGK